MVGGRAQRRKTLATLQVIVAGPGSCSTLVAENLALEAGVHPVYLASVFRRIHRQTIGEYVRALRIRRAVHLLRQVDMPLAEAAVMLGFADQAHFTRIFRELVGMTPSAFRRLLCPRRPAYSTIAPVS